MLAGPATSFERHWPVAGAAKGEAMTGLKAVIFDIGGVLTSSPVTAIRDYLVAQGADYAVLGPLIASPESAWSRWERSEIDARRFIEEFEAETSASGVTVSGRGVIDAAFGGQRVREDMVGVVRHLKGLVALGCITNNVARDDGEVRPGALDLYSLFEVVVESAKVGMRKPDPRIYQLACDQLGVAPPEAAFLDDLGANLKGARALGMTTIKVDHTASAIGELERALGLPLPR